MRISTAYQYDSYQRGINAAHERMISAQQRVQTGKRLTRPSDDPFGTTLVLGMNSLKSSLQQYQTNLQNAKGSLGFTEQSLSDMNDVMTRAYTLAVSGANGATDQAGRNAMAQEVADLQKHLVDLGNSKGPNGEFLFAGQKTDAPPFTAGAGTLTYNGDTNLIRVETTSTDTLVINSPGSPLVTDAYQRLEALRQNLLNGNNGNISDLDIKDLQSSMSAINLERGTVGSRLSTIATLTNQHARRTEELTSDTADIEEVDATQAILDYQSANTAYQAALSVASQGFKLSLMDFIRG